MTPRLKIKIFNLNINSFHFFGISGYITGTILGILLANLLKLQPLVVLLLAGIGAGTFFVMVIIAEWIFGKENIVYYHHEIAILIICSAPLKLMGLPVLIYLDITILGIASFLAFGRIGCLSVGCCHGRPAKKGIVYSHEHVKAGFTPYYEGVALLPVQLIESLFVFIVVIIGSLLLLHHRLPGTVLIFYTVVYGTFRFVLEFFRGDPERPYFKGLSEAQWTTLLLIAISIIMSWVGITPLYNWHIIIVVLLFSFGLTIILRKSIGDELTNPRHVKQIAIALNKAYRDELPLMEEKDSALSVNIFQTKKGLNLSAGQLNNSGNIVNHYTISFRQNNMLTFTIVIKLATIIQHIQKHKVQFEIYQSKNAVFHILFKE